MRKFMFSLQRLLSLREYTEKEWETKLGEITSRCNGFRRDIRKREELHSNILGNRKPGTSLEELQVSELFMLRMRDEVSNLRQELEIAETRRDEVQQKYLEASRERKVLTRLKERQEAEYYREQVKEEMKLIDDINTSAAVRKRNMSSYAGDMEV